MSCGDIAAALTDHFGLLRGFSERNVSRWCSEQGLGVKDFCPDRRLEGEVVKAIEEVGQSLSLSNLAHHWFDLQSMVVADICFSHPRMFISSSSLTFSLPPAGSLALLLYSSDRR